MSTAPFGPPMRRGTWIALFAVIVAGAAILYGLSPGLEHSGAASANARERKEPTGAPAKDAAASPAARYEALVAAANKSLGDKQLIDAYAGAADAVKLDPNRFEGYALEAMVMQQQGNLKKAAELVEQALALAPQEKKPALDRLKAMIADAGTIDGKFREHFDAARLAASQHKLAKAAEEYQAAWKAKPDEGDAGLQASVAYAALEDYPSSVAIARQLATSSNAEIAAKAKAHLDRLAPLLEPTIRAKTADGEDLLAEGAADRAEARIRDGIAYDPQPGYLTFLLARSLAAQGKTAAALDAADQAVALGFAQKEGWLSAPELAPLCEEKRFVQLIEDTFGKKSTEGLAQKLRAAKAVGAKGILTNSIGMRLKRIRPGTFTMGSPAGEEGRFETENEHKVTLTKGFFIQTTPVTQAQWAAVMGTSPSNFKGDTLPVEQVSWNDAVDFCRRLGEKEGKRYRLPTEAEWEYACRAGTTTRYNTGDGEQALAEAGWYSANSGNQTHPVGSKTPNKWELYDMHGNVWQWCSDFYGPYGGDATDPTGPATGDEYSSRVLRGGSWDHNPANCRAAFRGWNAPGIRINYIGFRVCLDFQ